MKTDFSTAYTAVSNALDSCGIGHDLQTRFNAATDAITAFCCDLQRRATNQLLYDLTTNVPCGILDHEQATGPHAIRAAIAGAVGSLVKWDITEALEIAADIAEDVNAHSEAAQIRAIASA